MTKKGELFLRTFKSIQDKRQRILDGKINCIPWGFPRFEEESPGIEKGKIYLVTAATKVGKTQITDWLFLYNVIQQVIDNKLDIRLKIFYFTLEMSKEEKMLSCFSNILYMKEGIVISPKDLKSTKYSKPLSQEYLDIIQKYQPYFDKIEEVVEFIDSVRHPFGIFTLVRDYAMANGEIHYKDIDIDGNITKVVDYYEPKDPDEYVITIIDHIGLISSEKRNGVHLSLHESMSVLSSDYLIKLRNRFNYIGVIVQQQALVGENIEHKKAGMLRPSLANLGDNKLTSRDINVAFGLFSPYRNEIPEYMGYDITQFKDNIRFLEIITARDGGAGTICPLYFNGAVNYFKELPKPENKAGIEQVYNFMKNIKKN